MEGDKSASAAFTDNCDESEDPAQIFKVKEINCHEVHVCVLNGKNITRGNLHDLVDTPDPYVMVWFPGTPNRRRRTKTIDNTRNPVWNQKFVFLVDAEEHNKLALALMEEDVINDDLIGDTVIDINDMPLDQEKRFEIIFENGSTVYLKLLRKKRIKTDLRFSSSLCEEEEIFIRKRKVHVMKAMQEFLGREHAPRSMDEVPHIGVLGSGGGFGALIGYSGACTALCDLGIMDCVMFIASLSGSSWYLSYLYSHPEFPETNAGFFQAELREELKECWMRYLQPNWLWGYVWSIIEKSVNGQPVSFTDFFGHLLGEVLLHERKDARLSDQRKALHNGQAPLPLYTCLNVKKDVSAKVFQEWLEFSPYEIGVTKYGTFMKPEDFGSKFFLGNKILSFREPPLHYLQGIWGSAYSILLKQLVMDTHDCREYELCDFVHEGESLEMNNDSGSSESEVESNSSDDEQCVTHQKNTLQNETSESSENALKSLRLEEKEMITRDIKLMEKKRVRNAKKRSSWMQKRIEKRNAKIASHKTFWQKTLDALLKTEAFNSRVIRAGQIYNYMRGLHLQNTFGIKPRTPTKPGDDKPYLGLYEPIEVQKKKLYLVDSGLIFNLPFPLLLRPQRGINMYLSFDFSHRNAEFENLFEELLLSEQWALLHGLKFPPVSKLVKKFVYEPLRECYVFKDENDLLCPVIVHFVLMNKTFRDFKAPGIRRETEEEKEFANFEIFTDPKYRYSTFKFQYTNEEFDRLANLVEFNTLLYEEEIKRQMIEAVRCKRLLSRKTVNAKKVFKKTTK